MSEWRNLVNVGFPSYPPEISPEWVLYHLIRHEATHQGQILMLRSQMKALS